MLKMNVGIVYILLSCTWSRDSIEIVEDRLLGYEQFSVFFFPDLAEQIFKISEGIKSKKLCKSSGIFDIIIALNIF